MICNKCGQEVPKDGVFCPNCGTSISKKSIAGTDNGEEGKRTSVKWLIPVGIAGVLIVAVILVIIGVSNSNGKAKNAVQNKLSEKQYNEILDAYLEYCEEKSNVYAAANMTLTMDADNKPILLLFFAKDVDAATVFLEIDTYENGNVKTLRKIVDCGAIAQYENGILYYDTGEGQYEIIQIKDNKIRLLGEKCFLESEHGDKLKYTLYCDDKGKSYVIEFEERGEDSSVKQYENEVKEWISYVYGDNNHYLDWMTECSIKDFFYCGNMQMIFFSSQLFYSPGQIQNLNTFMLMIQSLKAEPKYTWKEFLSYCIDRFAGYDEDDEYKKDYYESFIKIQYPDIDISWLTELETIKKMPFADEHGIGSEAMDLNFDDMDTIYSYLLNMDNGFAYETEDKHYEYIRLIDSYKKRENNNSLFEKQDFFEGFIQDIYKDIDDNWICEYLGVDSIEETVGKTVDNVAILTDFYEWIQSDEHQKLFEQEYEKQIKEKEWKQPYIDYFNSKSDSDNKGYSDEWSFKLLDINEDGKPEIFVFGNSTADGDHVFCIDKEGKVQQTYLGSGFSPMLYEKDKNLVFHSGSGMDNYFVNIFTVDDRGYFNKIHTGSWTTEWFSGGTSLEEPIVTYFWDETEVNEETYNKSLQEAFDEKNAISISGSDGELKDILSIINEIKYDDILARNNQLDSMQKDSWQEAYIDYIDPEVLFHKEEYRIYEEECEEYALCDINKDGIPEVICAYDRYTQGFAIVLAYDSSTGTVIENVCVGREYFTNNDNEFIESYDAGSHQSMGIYTLNEKGELKREHMFSYARYGEGEENWYKDGEEITKAQYDKYQTEYSDREAVAFEYNYNELISKLETS